MNSMEALTVYLKFTLLYTHVRGAVYLDVVPDVSSRSFVNSMKQFVSRHGIPKFLLMTMEEILLVQKSRNILDF